MRNGGQKGLHALEPHRPLLDFCVHLGHPQARPAGVFLSNPHHFHSMLVLEGPPGFFLCFSPPQLFTRLSSFQVQSMNLNPCHLFPH